MANQMSTVRGVLAAVAGLLALLDLFLGWARLEDPILHIVGIDISGWTLTNEGRLIEGSLVTLFLIPLAGILLLIAAALIFQGRLEHPGSTMSFFATAVLLAVPLIFVTITYNSTLGRLISFLPAPFNQIVNAAVSLKIGGGVGLTIFIIVLCVVLGVLSSTGRGAGADVDEDAVSIS